MQFPGDWSLGTLLEGESVPVARATVIKAQLPRRRQQGRGESDR
jgi:hypothetical protein